MSCSSVQNRIKIHTLLPFGFNCEFLQVGFISNAQTHTFGPQNSNHWKMLNNYEPVFDVAKATKCRHGRRYGEILQRRIDRKWARINDNFTMIGVLARLTS